MDDKSTRNIPCCSFCGKPQDEVKKLIAGPKVFICDECIELCMDILRNEKMLKTEDPHAYVRQISHKAEALLRQVDIVLEEEAARHRPYAKLQEQALDFRAHITSAETATKVSEKPVEAIPASEPRTTS